jgi:anti-sigma factor RsiW
MMNGRIIPMRDEAHNEAVALLPWYAVGALAPDEAARVEAHLEGCAECQAELKFDRRIGPQIASLPLDVERGWADMRRRITVPAAPPAAARRRNPVGPRLAAAWRASIPWLGGALAGQAAALVVLAGAWSGPVREAAAYHALGAAPGPRTGDIIVVFRPETPERALRDALLSSHARLVDGPTSTDAYLLKTPPGERTAALQALRRRAEVALAEPVDASGSP